MSGHPCDDIDCGQPPFNYQPEDAYGRQLLWHLIATVLLVAITALAWLSLIGLASGDRRTLSSIQAVNLHEKFIERER
jgi:ABC-type amino acid transport system permease subunit